MLSMHRKHAPDTLRYNSGRLLVASRLRLIPKQPAVEATRPLDDEDELFYHCNMCKALKPVLPSHHATFIAQRCTNSEQSPYFSYMQ